MKKYALRILRILVIIAISAYLPVISSTAQEAEQDKPVGKKDETAASKLRYLENVLFEKLPGKERVNLIVSEQPVIKAEGQTNGSLLVKLEDTSAPENLRQGLGEGQLSNILRVTPSERQVNGKQWIYLMIDIKEVVPYSIKQEGKNVRIDFNVASLPEKKTPVSVPVAAEKTPQVTSKKAEATAEKIQPIKKEASYTASATRLLEKNISIDFQDADIKSVLRLMAEYGNVSIVSGDDVKGNITLSMKNVPWQQALDTILDVNGLAKKEMGSVISVITVDRKKKDEATKAAGEADQIKAEELRRSRERKLLAEQGKLRQILIEAKIVEATDDFARNLGINWGFGKYSSIGTYGSAVVGGTNTATTNANLQGAQYPPEITATDSTGNPLYMAAVNMASALLGVPTLGVVFGKGSNFLEAQLAALEKTTSGKIISSPKVVTMDDVKAIIKQGQEVPYTTPASGTSPATVSFKEALLKLEVKPKITDEGKISMEIKASNDRPDWSRSVQGNPPIGKNEVESTVVISDGDTVVICGISQEADETV
jgi:type IV pilus assembly protein PilQ